MGRVGCLYGDSGVCGVCMSVCYTTFSSVRGSALGGSRRVCWAGDTTHGVRRHDKPAAHSHDKQTALKSNKGHFQCIIFK